MVTVEQALGQRSSWRERRILLTVCIGTSRKGENGCDDQLHRYVVTQRMEPSS